MDPRLEVASKLFSPGRGNKLWYGGPTPIGVLRGVTHTQAAWIPAPGRHCIWELTLHIAYWNYAVRRILEDLPKGGFPRSPANWPEIPSTPTAKAWKDDRALLSKEHKKLEECLAQMEGARLDDIAPGSQSWRLNDLVFGAVTHDIYHIGQIQLLKRLCTVA